MLGIPSSIEVKFWRKSDDNRRSGWEEWTKVHAQAAD
jgi:hypothetical protein